MNKIFTGIILISLTCSLFAQKPAGPFLKLDGDGDFMQLSAWADSLIFDGPVTIEFWARADFNHKYNLGMIWAINDGNPIGGDNAESFELRYGANTSGITNELLTIFYSLWSINAYGTRYDDNIESQWHHFAFVCGNDAYAVYIDGQLQELTASSSVANDIPKTYGAGFIPKENVALGARWLDGASSYGFHGSIDDFRIWNVQRSADQIQQTMNDTLDAAYYNSTDSGLVAYWRFDDEEDLGIGGGNPDIRDFSVHGYHGDLAGNAAVAWEPFTDINAALSGAHSKSVVWGDYDNDHDLDILLSDEIYNNDKDSFTSVSQLTHLAISSSAWGDYNNDGNLDILLSGLRSDQIRYSMIYLNSDDSFTNINAGLAGAYNGSVAWGDYDNDGDQDILLSGSGNSGQIISKIYRNDDSLFADSSVPLQPLENGSAAWADYDNDGDLDILLTGNNGNKDFSRIYRNDGGIFTDMNIVLTPSVIALSPGAIMIMTAIQIFF